MNDTARWDQVEHELRAWLKEHWDPASSVRAWWAKLAESGWGYPTWPREWFGRALPAEYSAGIRGVVNEAGVLPPAAGLGQSLGGPTVIAHGSAEHKRRFLPALARGEEAWCQFFSEPGSGSDLASAQTRAVRHGDGWIVSGQKVWTSGAQTSDRGMLLARTDVDVPKHRGLTYFIIDLDQPGVEVRPLHQMNGAHGFNEVFFTDAVVPAGRIVGEENGGWTVAVTTLMFERFMASLPSAPPGRRSAALDRSAGEVVDEVRAEAHGRSALVNGLAPLLAATTRDGGSADDPLVRHAVADLALAERLDGLSARRQSDAVRAGERPSAAGSLRKLARSDLARKRSDTGMATLGAAGMLTGPDTPTEGQVQMLALSAPSTSIAGGTDEIQRNIVGERVLGLPKEPSSDRTVAFRDLTVGTRRDPAS